MTEKTLTTLDEWIAVLVEVVKDNRTPMKVPAAQKLTARICKVSEARMPFVVTSAVKDGLLVWDTARNTLALPE